MTIKKAPLDTVKKLLAAQVKLDIALAIHKHPHLQGAEGMRAFTALANDDTVEGMVTDLAREEVEAAVARGELPAAAFLRLAGYRVNELAEG